jgi:hypothetical protein
MLANSQAQSRSEPLSGHWTPVVGDGILSAYHKDEHSRSCPHGQLGLRKNAISGGYEIVRRCAANDPADGLWDMIQGMVE